MSEMKPIISDDPFIQSHFEKCLRLGTPAKLAEMFALGATPYIQTDSVFLQGSENGRQFAGNDKVGDYYAAVARKHGQMVKGKKYISGIARFPGDPEAWVDGRGDVERVARQRGWGVEGAVKVSAEPSPPPPDIALSERIVAERAQRVLESHPEPHKVDVGELKEQIRQKHGKKKGG